MLRNVAKKVLLQIYEVISMFNIVNISKLLKIDCPEPPLIISRAIDHLPSAEFVS